MLYSFRFFTVTLIFLLYLFPRKSTTSFRGLYRGSTSGRLRRPLPCHGSVALCRWSTLARLPQPAPPRMWGREQRCWLSSFWRWFGPQWPSWPGPPGHQRCPCRRWLLGERDHRSARHSCQPSLFLMPASLLHRRQRQRWTCIGSGRPSPPPQRSRHSSLWPPTSGCPRSLCPWSCWCVRCCRSTAAGRNLLTMPGQSRYFGSVGSADEDQPAWPASNWRFQKIQFFIHNDPADCSEHWQTNDSPHFFYAYLWAWNWRCHEILPLFSPYSSDSSTMLRGVIGTSQWVLWSFNFLYMIPSSQTAYTYVMIWHLVIFIGIIGLNILYRETFTAVCARISRYCTVYNLKTGLPHDKYFLRGFIDTAE